MFARLSRKRAGNSRNSAGHLEMSRIIQPDFSQDIFMFFFFNVMIVYFERENADNVGTLHI